MSADRDTLERWVKIISILVAVGTFLFGVAQYVDAQRDQQAAARQAEAREARQKRLDAARPFLDRQLVLYTDAVRSAAIISSSDDAAAVARATARFEQLYWGELAMVEDRAVEGAMVLFGKALARNYPKEDLAQCSLKLAHTVRQSLANAWGADVWKSHYDSQSPPRCRTESEP